MNGPCLCGDPECGRCFPQSIRCRFADIHRKIGGCTCPHCSGDCGCFEDLWEDNMSDVEADADTLRNAGMGTDEDYGYYERDNEWEGDFDNYYDNND